MSTHGTGKGTSFLSLIRGVALFLHVFIADSVPLLFFPVNEAHLKVVKREFFH